MEKSAKSSDPVQQALRDHKKNWNLAAKEFIKRIIALKQVVSGKGNSNYGLPPSNIKDPLPREVGSFLDELSSNFEQLAREALTIQQEQAQYSKTRRKSRKEMEALNMTAKVYVKQLVKTASVDEDSVVQLGDHTFNTLLAVTAEEQAKGLMFAEWPPPVMSFIYGSPQNDKFWMKNTPSPLDIVFALDGKITTIRKGEPYSTNLIASATVYDLVIELPFGTCEKLGIKEGDSVNLNCPPEKIAGKLSKKYSF